jgi:hypothetical protein
MISLLLAALLFLNVSSSSSPTAVEQLTNLRQQANAAREAGDHAARLQVVQPVPFREETLSSGAEAQMFVRTLWPD